MDNELLTFNSEEFGNVRSVEIDGEPWFYGSDVAKALGYALPQKAIIDHVWDEDKNTVPIRNGIPGNPNRVLINESGLYSLIFHSNLDKAREFSHWVTLEVLPSIRKHGAYITKELLEDKKRLKKEIEELRKENAKLTHKPTYEKYIERRNWDSANVNTVAADFDLSARKLNAILERTGIQYKAEDNRWHIADKYINSGYVKEERYNYGNGYCVTMKWTKKGCLFIADVLKDHHIFPLVEIN